MAKEQAIKKKTEKSSRQTLSAQLVLPEKTLELPIIVGTENEKAVDISKLRSETSYITLDNGFMNTGACRSAITYIDGEKGILRYRGIPIEQLAGNATFVEVAYLLIYGKLPNKDELALARKLLSRHAMIHEDMKRFFDGYPAAAHPMAILSSMICSLSSYYPETLDLSHPEDVNLTIIRLISKVRTIAAFSYKKSIGQPFVYQQDKLSYCANFLNMMFSIPTREYLIDQDVVDALNLLLILHADHEQNCSTSTVRLAGSSQANLYASISAGICALWGPLHGGANEAVIRMLQQISDEGGNCKKFVALAKDKQSKFRLMGFGHRVYKNYDPRAAVLKKSAKKILSKMGKNDPLLMLAQELEEIALKDSYFIEKKLYPNVDFYSGIIYRAIGIPSSMFTVMFALGRLPGWIAQWKEMVGDPDSKLGRPRQIYIGEKERPFVPLEKRR
ncbi:MAG: citrate (Si)-synthase [Candidatus Omnitrophica bacterium CG11_big_fil_rev_8_21_14_0_20_45_26]|uniref:Citrate synthase n=1 Tax=Candidatus Abzuiibacterium crystallinum TaxID=1974748 RepID=A0A2H0LVN5_9BACT|nr:MAG: citrate (Si)-synthase [Candidatus Omnitrophica bacterium CG11_big_fil_rev_8_21_14_0_20_45_26]PIW65452.1 MAG: citrate (Si)-synthase [Candidatus Omnitrophica bacterium CG12_big_fil_rev_8_21_14_0_65_45_16]